jgi:transposase
MARRLRAEEVVTIKVLFEKGLSKRSIARQLGVADRTVRYHLQRQESGAEDGRRGKPRHADAYREVIAAWYETRALDRRPPNVLELYEHLVREHGYRSSYKSVLRFVRAEYPAPRLRTYRRVETPPGAQAQTDWGEFPGVDVGRGPEHLHAFVMVLSHSRKRSVVWSRREHQLSWLHCHNESFRRLRGVPAVNRVDNVKTAISRGAGAWGEINPTYRTYARQVGFHIDACPPRAGNAKGKVERSVGVSRYRLDPYRRRYDGLADLQDETDHHAEKWAEEAICPATGQTVRESWDDELLHLAPVPILPEPFDVVVTRPVSRDCIVHFEGRIYGVPFRFAGRRVEVRGCAGRVQILGEGRVVKEWPRHTKERILIDPDCFEGEATERVIPPPPLGRMGRRLQEIMETPVEKRPIDLYAALAEVAR